MQGGGGAGQGITIPARMPNYYQKYVIFGPGGMVKRSDMVIGPPQGKGPIRSPPLID